MLSPSKKNGFLRVLFTSSMVFVLSRAAGLLVPFVLALSYGVSQFMDDFFLALAFQSFIGITLGSLAEVVVVPSLTSAKGGEVREGPFLRLILKWGFAVALVFVALLAFPASLFLSNNAMSAYWALSFYPPLAVCSGILLGAFNAREHFNWTSGIPGARAVIIVLGLVLLPSGKLWILATIITGAEFILLAFLLTRASLLEMFQGVIGTAKPWALLKNTFILSLGTFLLCLNPLVDKTFASFVGPGSISLMEYSFVLFYVPANLLHGPLLTILLTRWSKEGSRERILSESRKSIFWIILVSLSAFVVFLLIGRTLLEWGLGSRISKSDLDVLWLATTILLGSLAPYVIGGMYSRVLLIAGMTRSISVFACLNALLNLCLNLLLVNFLGLYGILLSTSLTSFILALTIGWFTWRNYLHPQFST